MKKPATTSLLIDELLKQRWSPRAFVPTAVSQEQMDIILEAARWAPSSGNVQNWKFYYAHQENENSFQKLRKLLQGGNNAWAPQADVLLLAVVQNIKNDKGEWNFHSFLNVGLAIENLLLQVTASGLFAHPMAGFDAEQAKNELNLSDHEMGICMIAIGHLGDADLLVEPFKTRETAPRERKSLAEISVRL